MALREKDLRLSPEWQERFAASERMLDKDWLDCVEELQVQVVSEFGLPESATHLLRTAHLLHPDEAFFKEVPLHVRFNRARNGPLQVGVLVPHVPVVTLNGVEKSLFDFGGNESRPLILIGGSRS